MISLCSNNSSGICFSLLSKDLSHAEVRNLGVEVLIKQDIGSLEISVDYSEPRIMMEIYKPSSYTTNNVEPLWAVKRSFSCFICSHVLVSYVF